MINCPNCQTQNQDDTKFCISCGANLHLEPNSTSAETQAYQIPPEQQTYTPQPETQNYQPPVNQAPPSYQSPVNQAPMSYQAPVQQSQYNQYSQPVYGSQPSYQQPYGPPVNNTGQIVWAIINIVLGCGSCIGLVLAIIALVNAVQAKSAINPQIASSKLKTANTLNIVATILAVIGIILSIILFSNGVYDSILNGRSSYDWYY